MDATMIEAGRPVNIPNAETVSRIARALNEVGAHPSVPVEVLAIALDLGAPPYLSVELNLHYRRAAPVCCGEPGCYTPFLGTRRHEVPRKLAGALGLQGEPGVRLVVHLVYEEGYRHTALGEATPCTLRYAEDEFRAATAAPAPPHPGPDRGAGRGGA